MSDIYEEVSVFYSDIEVGDKIIEKRVNTVVVKRKKVLPEPEKYALVRHLGGQTLFIKSGSRWKALRVNDDRRRETDPQDWLTWSELIEQYEITEVTELKP